MTDITMELHPYCTLFPDCSEEELQMLTDDIRQNGLLEPIVLFDGKILDGRNRYMACLRSNTKPRTIEFTGNDPLGFVLSKNLHRRQLSESQRAAIAAEIANMRRGYNKQEEYANLRISQSQSHKGVATDGNFGKESKSTDLPRISQKEAAKMMNVSQRSVNTAAKILKEASPEVVQQVKDGKKTLNAAMTERKPKEKQQAVPRKKNIAKAEEPKAQDNFLVIPLPFERQSMFDEICKKVFLAAGRDEQVAMYYEFCETIRLMHDYLNSHSK